MVDRRTLFLVFICVWCTGCYLLGVWQGRRSTRAR